MHVGTRSSTQARSHAQKFFVKLEKKQQTMEQYLDNIDINRMKTMIDNDSDYDDSEPMLSNNNGDNDSQSKKQINPEAV